MNRIELLADWLANRADAVLIETEVSRQYLTEFSSSDGLLVVGRWGATLLVDGRYDEAAREQACGCEVVLLERLPEQLPALLRAQGVHRALVETGVRVSTLQRYQEMLPDVELLADGSLDAQLERMRCVKQQREMDSLRAAQQIADRAFLEVVQLMRVGMTERKVAAELEYRMRRGGSEKESFDTIVVSGPNSSLPHGVPGERPLETGDFVTMDFGAVVNGYHSDMTRTVAMGRADEEMQKVYETVLQAQCAALDVIQPGVTGQQADAAARDVIVQAGYGPYFCHSTGHGVGLEVHEGPNLSARATAPLQPGQVVTVEPGIYLPGRFGVRIEDFVLVTPEGSTNLVQSPKQLLVL